MTPDQLAQAEASADEWIRTPDGRMFVLRKVFSLLDAEIEEQE